MRPKVVLVPLDGSRLAEEALEPAIGFAREGARVVLLRAVEAHGAPFVDPADAQVAAIEEAENYLASAAARLRSAGTDVETSVWYGPPAQAIADAARLRKADLIVMSTHGRSGLGRLVLGSVAESVLRATSTPILLLRPETPAWIDGRTHEAVHV